MPAGLLLTHESSASFVWGEKAPHTFPLNLSSASRYKQKLILSRRLIEKVMSVTMGIFSWHSPGFVKHLLPISVLINCLLIRIFYLQRNRAPVSLTCLLCVLKIPLAHQQLITRSYMNSEHDSFARSFRLGVSTDQKHKALARGEHNKHIS